MNESNDKRVALITGANKGIGFEAARQLGQLGIRVLVGSRDQKRGAEAVQTLLQEGIDARAVALEVTEQASIDAAVKDIQAHEGRLDILVNNAGIGLDRRPPSEIDLATLRRTLDTNFFGAVAVVQALVPLIKRSSAGRIVNVSSTLGSLHHLSDPEWIGYKTQFTAYSLSKVALNGFTAVLSAELHGTTAKVNSVEPGYTATDMTAHQGFQTPAQAARVIVKYATIGPDGPTGGYFDINGRMPW